MLRLEQARNIDLIKVEVQAMIDSCKIQENVIIFGQVHPKKDKGANSCDRKRSKLSNEKRGPLPEGVGDDQRGSTRKKTNSGEGLGAGNAEGCPGSQRGP